MHRVMAEVEWNEVETTFVEANYTQTHAQTNKQTNERFKNKQRLKFPRWRFVRDIFSPLIFFNLLVSLVSAV